MSALSHPDISPDDPHHLIGSAAPRPDADGSAYGTPRTPVTVDLGFLRAHPSAALPPSPFSPLSYSMLDRPRAPTPHGAGADDALWSPDSAQSSHELAYADPPSAGVPPRSDSLYGVPDDEPPFAHATAPLPGRRLARPTALPDPSQFPDPYPNGGPVPLRSPPPSLVSDSSSGSARSSAYTSMGSTLAVANENVQVASSFDDAEVLPAALRQLRLKSSKKSLRAAPASPPREPERRWPEMIPIGLRSRSSSTSQHAYGGLDRISGYDASWEAVDEGDEGELMSDVETDDEDLRYGLDEHDEDRTAAVVIAEEGRGLIVRGDGKAVGLLDVQPGTTHLLVGSSSTPNAVPNFLAINLPQTSHSLLALDISANFLVALPPALAACVHLEELNIASNPLRVLPVFLAHLTELRVLIADSTGIAVLPEPLCGLDKLHTLSVRRNKLHSLPGWLCLLPSLQTLLVDGNPFLGPWKSLVDPILAKEGGLATTPLMTPATPSGFSVMSAGSSVAPTSDADTEESNERSSLYDGIQVRHPADEEDTIIPSRVSAGSQALAGHLDTPAVDDNASIRSGRSTLSRSKTAGGRERHNSSTRRGLATRAPSASRATEPQLRKMKSLGELHDPSPAVPPFFASLANVPQRPPLSSYVSTPTAGPYEEEMSRPAKFATLGPSSATGSPEGSRSSSRTAIQSAFWDNISGDEGPSSPPRVLSSPMLGDSASTMRARGEKADKDKDKDKSKWGFLKKMSMARMKNEVQPAPPVRRPRTATTSSVMPRIHEPPPQVDIRFSAIAPLDVPTPSLSRQASKDQLRVQTKPSTPTASLTPEPLKLAPPAGGLMPPSTPRSARRRSFLPLDGPPALSIPIPLAAPFMSDLTLADDADASESKLPSPAVSVNDGAAAQQAALQATWREQERAREVYGRALRAVLAYLRDMYDLGLSHGAQPAPELAANVRSRRPTMGEVGRTASEQSLMSATSDASVTPANIHSQLRAMTSMNVLRSVPASQTASIATTDSGGSGGGAEERKFKDDKSKRALIVREIVETERTYVKGLEELVDIYIRPASMTISNLTGPKQETVVPAAERKVVFGGIEALFSFHKHSFLPELEKAAAPVLKAGPRIAEIDTDGRLSLEVTMAVAHAFVSRAAFMRMYSTYINNFDNAVRRITSWTSERPGTATTPQTPSVSSPANAQLVGLGLAMSAVTSPGGTIDVTASPARLSSSQRKRIKAWQKRCRMHPRHSQLNMEGYLLLPVQRIPRYKLLIEDLIKHTPPMGSFEDPLDRALLEIASLATNMNEGKREAESRTKLVQWQARIRGSNKFPSPLVQPHRRLILDGPLTLTRVVRKTTASFEVYNPNGDPTTVQVDCLSPELTPRVLIGVLCNDLLVLCRDLSDGRDPGSVVELWAVLRMQTVPQPASIVHDNVIRIVDNKAVLYFNAPSASDALNWYTAININIPSSKT